MNGNQFPADLYEALGATPMTFLVPTQEISLGATAVEIEFLASNEQTDEMLHATGTGGLTEQDAQTSIDGLRKEAEEHSVIFEQIEVGNQPKDEANDGPNDSLFNGLSAFAKQVALQIPLVGDGEMRAVKQFEKRRIVQEKEQEDHKQEPEFKKQKFNDHNDLQHLIIENLTNERISKLVHEIGMTDDVCEYQDPNLWTELPNSKFVLSTEILHKFEEWLNKIIETKLIDEIEFSILERIEFLSLRSTEFIDDDQTNLSDTDKDLFKFVINSLHAVSLILLIFTTEMPDKKLYLDNFLSSSMNCFYKIIENIVLPSFNKPDTFNKKDSTELNQILNLSLKILNQIIRFIDRKQANDKIITKLEFLSISVFFANIESSNLNKSNLIKISAAHLILMIYKKFTDQRVYLINEILLNFDRLSAVNQKLSRQVVFRNGIQIQLITYLILSLLQCYDLNTVLQEQMKQKIQNQIQDEVQDLPTVILDSTNERNHILNMISTKFIKEIEKSSSNPIVRVFDHLVEDLSNVLYFKEYSSSSLLLYTLSNSVVFAISQQVSKTAPNNQNFDSELLDKLGNLVLINLTKSIENQDEEHEDPLGITIRYLSTIKYLITNKNVNEANNLSFELLVKLANDCNDSNSVSKTQSNHLIGKLLKFDSSISFEKLIDEIMADLHIDTNIENNSTQANQNYKVILNSSDFIKSFNSLFNEILKSLESPKAKLRTKSLKILSNLVEVKPKLLLIPAVKNLISQKIDDPSPLVRTSTLDMLEHYIFRKPDSINEIYNLVILTDDTSTSVRLKSIKIGKFICKQNLATVNQAIKEFIIENILNRVFEDDEESVIKNSKLALIDIFFGNLVSVLNNEILVKEQVLNFVGLINNLIFKNDKLNVKNVENFENFLNNEIVKRTEENFKTFELLQASLSKIVKYLIGFILEHFENNDNGNSVENYLGILSMFAKTNEKLIVQDDLLSLEPFLSIEMNQNNSYYYLLVIFNSSISKLNSLRPKLINNVSNILLRKISKLNSKELNEAVQLVWKLSKMNNSTDKIAISVLQCLVYLTEFNSDQKVANNKELKSNPKLIRLLFLIGTFGKYCKLENFLEMFENNKKILFKKNETVLSLIIRNLLFFTRKQFNEQTRKIAIKNVIEICTTHPKIFNNKSILKVLDQEFDTNDNWLIKSTILETILNGLKVKENLLENDKNSKNVSIDNKILDGSSKVLNEEAIWIGIVQKYLDPTCKVYECAEPSLIYSVLKYLKYIVKLGLIIPNKIVPTIICLEAHPTGYVRSLAIEIHKDMISTYEKLIEKEYIKGFHLLVSKDDVGYSPGFFSKFYSLIKESKNSKVFFNQFLNSLKFESVDIDIKQVKILKRNLIIVGSEICNCPGLKIQDIALVYEGLVKLQDEKKMVIDNKIRDMVASSENSNHSGSEDPELEWQRMYGLVEYAILLDRFESSIEKEFNLLKRESGGNSFTRYPLDTNIEVAGGSFEEKCVGYLNGD